MEFPYSIIDECRENIAPGYHSYGSMIYSAVIRRDFEGKFGLRMDSIEGQVFIWIVVEDSPAARAGLKFGDQVLVINGRPLAGMSSQEVIIMCGLFEELHLTLRRREFHESSFTLERNSKGKFGFYQVFGKIISVVRKSPAGREGLLTKHHIVSVNGKSTIGLNDGQIIDLINEVGDSITLTLVPSHIFGSLMSQAYISNTYLAKIVDRYKMYD